MGNPTDQSLTAVAIAKALSISNMAKTLRALSLSRQEQREMADILEQHAAELREAALAPDAQGDGEPQVVTRRYPSMRVGDTVELVAAPIGGSIELLAVDEKTIKYKVHPAVLPPDTVTAGATCTCTPIPGTVLFSERDNTCAIHGRGPHG